MTADRNEGLVVATSSGKLLGSHDDANVATSNGSDRIYVEPAELLAWATGIVQLLGTPSEIARDVGDVLVASDRRGITSHGTARLDGYLARIRARVMDPAARPAIELRSPTLAIVDARNGWGPHAGRIGMDLAVEGARSSGIGMAIVRNSNHFGIAGWYALRAVSSGFIGIALSNSAPLVAPTRGIRPVVGTNPIAIAAPAGDAGPFCLDMATSVVPRGRIEVAARRRQPLTEGWATDSRGHPTRDSQSGLAGALLPLGGSEATGGHKGYGLSLAVDILTGVIAGGGFGPSVRGLYDTSGPGNVSHTFIAMAPDVADSGSTLPFSPRLAGYCQLLINEPTADEAIGRVLIPGEPEAQAEREAMDRGIPLDRAHWHRLETIAADVGLILPIPKGEGPAGPGDGH